MPTTRKRAAKPKAKANAKTPQPDHTRCHWCILMRDGETWRQCKNGNGHGPFGMYCEEHAQFFEGIKDKRRQRDIERADAAYEAYAPVP